MLRLRRSRRGDQNVSLTFNVQRFITDLVTVLYLRLFYTEKYFGWNSEEWPTYLFWSLVVVFLPALFLSLVRRRNPKAAQVISGAAVFTICFICIPMCIILFFAAGRNSMFPLPVGVNEMPKFGCCFQSIIFPQSRAAELIKFYETRRIGFVDTLTEEYADEHDELRFAITPSLMQHIGASSSKDYEVGKTGKPAGRTESQTLWSFAFEEYDPITLRKEPKLASSSLAAEMGTSHIHRHPGENSPAGVV